jgi:photosystem II stability/assembly factor-like uncharacterized protein
MEGIKLGKKIVGIIIFILISSFTFAQKVNKLNGINLTTDRVALCEIFTSTSCVPCVSGNQIFDNWLRGYSKAGKVAVIKYHTWWPTPLDPYYSANTQNVIDRVNYYNVNGVPSLLIDGKDNDLFGSFAPIVENELSTSAQFEINISTNITSNTAKIDVAIKSNTDSVPGGLVLQTVLVETGLHYTGSNGDPSHEYVMRKMVPSAAGETFTMSSNETKTFTRTVMWDSTWVTENCRIIAFIQNVNTKQVLQAGIKSFSTKPSLSVGLCDLKLNYTSGSFSTTVLNVGVGTLNWNAEGSSGSDWLTLTNASGTSGNAFNVSYSENKGEMRTGKIKVSSLGAIGSPYECTVTQAGTPVGWVLQNSITNYYLCSVAAPNEKIGYAVGNPGLIYKTIDGGKNWVKQISGTTNALLKVYFSDANTGTAVGNNGTILRTVDGGANWLSQTSSTTKNLYSVYFTNTNIGVVVGGGGTILRTTNGGNNWTAQTSGATNFLYDIVCLDVMNYYVVGSWGLISHTTNGGANWTGVSQNGGVTSALNSIYFVNNNVGFAVGVGGVIIKTTNGGTNWFSIGNSNITNELMAMSFLNANNGFIVGYGGLILKTTDGGANWNTQSSGLWDDLFGIAIKNDFGLIVSYNGAILTKSSNATRVATEKLPLSFTLAQNYPNPFNPSTRIEYTIPENSLVELKIYDTFGREVETLVNKQLTTGTYSIMWEPKSKHGGVTSGVYYYRLKAGKFIETRKMIYIK